LRTRFFHICKRRELVSIWEDFVKNPKWWLYGYTKPRLMRRTVTVKKIWENRRGGVNQSIQINIKKIGRKW